LELGFDALHFMTFRFKRFSVNDDMSSMKVGTDAVLLGAWARHGQGDHILDIGTGSGLIALMIAQRYPEAHILGIDIHPASITEAKKNFKSSPWRERLSAKEISLQEFSISNPEKFGMIISNPPFFNDSLLPQTSNKMMARHTGMLGHDELAEGCTQLLTEKGKLSIILDMEGHETFNRHAQTKGLFLIRKLLITPVKGKAPNRILSEWGKKEAVMNTGNLCIRDRSGAFSPEYIELTRAFYLAL
jgi:tRNA1Val (adenine37-N6)-methyltransferase